MFEPLVSLYRSVYTSSQLVILLVALGLAITAVSVCAAWYGILKKVGHESPWKALIPVYNLFVMYELVQDVALLVCTLFSAFLALWLGSKVAFVGWVFGIITLVLMLVYCRHMAQSFGKGSGFALGLLVLPFVFYPVLALDKSEFQGRKHTNQEYMDAVRAFLTRTRTINIICVLIMILLIVLQWTPFWTFESAKNGTQSASIQQYIWTPTELTDLTKSLQAKTGISDLSVEKIMLTPLFELILFIAALLLCTWKGNRPLTAIIPIAMGLIGIFGYLSNPAFQLGYGWSFHLVLCVVLKDLGIVNLLMNWVRPEARAVKKH